MSVDGVSKVTRRGAHFHSDYRFCDHFSCAWPYDSDTQHPLVLWFDNQLRHAFCTSECLSTTRRSPREAMGGVLNSLSFRQFGFGRRFAEGLTDTRAA